MTLSGFGQKAAWQRLTGAAFLLWASAGLQGCHVFGFGPSMPDLSAISIAHEAVIQADQETVREIVAVFKHAGEAVSHQDLDSVMSVYAKNYKHRGYNSSSIRTVWKQLFEDHQRLSLTMVLSQLEVQKETTPPKARVVCTGSLWGVSNRTGKHINLDSWFDEVYYLVYENGAWRTQGHAWEVLTDKDTRFARPPHPFS